MQKCYIIIKINTQNRISVIPFLKECFDKAIQIINEVENMN